MFIGVVISVNTGVVREGLGCIRCAKDYMLYQYGEYIGVFIRCTGVMLSGVHKCCQQVSIDAVIRCRQVSSGVDRCQQVYTGIVIRYT